MHAARFALVAVSLAACGGTLAPPEAVAPGAEAPTRAPTTLWTRASPSVEPTRRVASEREHGDEVVPATDPAQAKELAETRLQRLRGTLQAAAHPFASAWLLAQLRSLESEAVDAVAALEPGAAWQRRYVHAWLTLDRLERTLDDAARNEGLMFTQRLEPGAGASDLERSAP